jgi:hemolysin activation/secretion protein
MMKPTTLKRLIALSCITSTMLLAAPPTSGDIEKQIVVPKVVTQKEAKEANAIPTLTPEAIKEPIGLENGKKVMVKRFSIVGAKHMGNDELKAMVAPYEHKELSFKEMEAVARLITKAYREKGYFVARAFVPKQDIFTQDNRLKIEVIEGNYGDFKLTNTSLVDTASVQAMLDDVKDENIVSTHTLERAMLW